MVSGMISTHGLGILSFIDNQPCFQQNTDTNTECGSSNAVFQTGEQLRNQYHACYCRNAFRDCLLIVVYASLDITAVLSIFIQW